MLKQTIKYTDLDGNAKEDDFYFNLNKAELMEMELTTKGGLANYLQKIVDTQDTQKIMTVFKTFILKAYGEKSEDGKRFIKSAELSEAFSQTDAYSELFMKLVTDENEAKNFMNGIIPNELRQDGANPIPPQISSK